MSATHTAIQEAIERYIAENEKFTAKGIAAAGTRARAALGDLSKLTKVRRAEIQEVKNSKKEAK